MYHNQKIGVFVSHIMGNYQKNFCQGIIDKASEYGYSIEIFASMDGENLGEYDRGEEGILNIPNYDRLSGILFASDTYPQKELKDKIYQTLKEKCHCPIIEIAAGDTLFPSVSLDNNRTTLLLTEHLIFKHGCKRICYLGCNEERDFSDKREFYYKEALHQSGLVCRPKDVFHASYSDTSVKAALSAFTAEESMPDAILCYNDKMALLLMQQALLQGFRIPEDFAVTGCDCTEYGQSITPSLTTVTFPAYEMGSTAVDTLISALHGNALPKKTIVNAEIVLGNSCGCSSAPCTLHQSPLFYMQSLSQRIEAVEASILNSMHMSAAFRNVTDIDEGMDLLENYVQNISHCKEFYLCLYADWDSFSGKIWALTSEDAPESSPKGEMLLKLAIRDGKRLAECSFQKLLPLPEYIYLNSDSVYHYIPLYFGERKFGYIALSYEENQIDYHFRFIQWFMNINQMLERICELRKTSLLVTHLEDVYMKDALTGLYNRHGYLQKINEILQNGSVSDKPVTAFLFDLDNVKYINDNFGHDEGDFAIQVLGHALMSVISSEELCARFRGDEFHLLSYSRTKEDADEFIARVQKYLNNYNRLNNKPYPISVSGGYAQISGNVLTNENQIEALFKEASEYMLKQKRERQT